MANEIPLYNPNVGLTGRDGGPYLDEVQAHEAEKRRAIVEGRDPDLENPAAGAGIPLVTAAEMLQRSTVQHPSQQNASDVAAAAIFASAEDYVPSEVKPRGVIRQDEVDRLNADVEDGKNDEYRDRNLFDVRDELEGEDKPAQNEPSANNTDGSDPVQSEYSGKHSDPFAGTPASVTDTPATSTEDTAPTDSPAGNDAAGNSTDAPADPGAGA